MCNYIPHKTTDVISYPFYPSNLCLWKRWNLPLERQESTYLTNSVSWLLISWCCLESSRSCRVRVNTLRPRQNGSHFPDDIFNFVFFNLNVWMLIKISLKFVPKGLINNIPALVQIMAWRQPDDKPLSEAVMVITDAYMRHLASMS